MSNQAEAVHNPIRINPETCVRCNLCDWICPGDLIYKEEDNRETLPVIKYPDECWYCGSCEEYCPTDAVKIVFPEEMLHSQTPAESLFGKFPEETKGNNKAAKNF